MATASPVSSRLSSRGGSLDTTWSQLHYTTSPRKLKRLQSAQTDVQQSESKCKRCGWLYPIQNPNSRQRRLHKKICPKRSIGSEEEIESSGGHGGGERSESVGSILTGDHEHKLEQGPSEVQEREGDDQLKQDSSKRPTHSGHYGSGAGEQKVEGFKGKEFDSQYITGKEPQAAHSPGRDQLKRDSSTVPTHSGHYGSGAGEQKVEGFKGKEFDSQHVTGEEPQAAHSPGRESDKESGSDSGLSSAPGERETDPSDEMGFDSSDITDVAKRGDSLPSGDEMIEEEKKYGAMQHSHTDLQRDTESSHRPDSEGEEKPVNIANLISKYDKGKASSASLPSAVKSDYIPLVGSKRSIPSTSGEVGQLSLRSKDHKHGGEIIPAEEILEGRLSTARGPEYDLEAILSKQKTHDLICPICGSQITNTIIIKKRRKAFLSKNGTDPNLTEISPEDPDQENTAKTVTTGRKGTWVERCLGYLGLFHRDG